MKEYPCKSIRFCTCGSCRKSTTHTDYIDSVMCHQCGTSTPVMTRQQAPIGVIMDSNLIPGVVMDCRPSIEKIMMPSPFH